MQWSLVAFLAAGLLGAFVLVFRLPPAARPAAAGTGQTAPLQLARPAGNDDVLKDEALIRDLRPLFLPTAYNAALAEPRREPGRTILDEDRMHPDFKESEPGFARELAPVATLNGRAADQARGNDALAVTVGEVGLIGIGRGVRRVEPLAPRGGFVEVVVAASGKSVLAQPLPESMAPVGGKAWEPMEFFAAVDATGLAAPLVVTVGSRVEEVDVHFKKVLAQVFRIGDRLPPGFYRVVVGP